MRPRAPVRPHPTDTERRRLLQLLESNPYMPPRTSNENPFNGRHVPFASPTTAWQASVLCAQAKATIPFRGDGHMTSYRIVYSEYHLLLLCNLRHRCAFVGSLVLTSTAPSAKPDHLRTKRACASDRSMLDAIVPLHTIPCALLVARRAKGYGA